jgi:DNA-binding CsgD family transcriptional regulator
LHTAVAAQFGEALETLLFSLRHIDAKIVTSKWAGPAQSSMRELTETALREISWFSEILKRLGHDPKAQKASSGSITRNTEDHHFRRTIAYLRSIDYAASPGCSSYLSDLSKREHEVLVLIVSGSTNKEGGAQLGISSRTFEVHRANIIRKVGARNTADLVRLVVGPMSASVRPTAFSEPSPGAESSPADVFVR